MFCLFGQSDEIRGLGKSLPRLSGKAKARTLIRLADLCREDPIEGMKYADQAAVISAQLNDNNLLAQSQTMKGELYFASEKYDSALLYLETALPVFEKGNDKTYLCIVTNLMGMTQIRKGDLRSAEKMLGYSIELSDTSPRLFNYYLSSVNSLAVIHYYEGNLRKSAEEFIRLYELHKQKNDQKNIATVAGNIGGIFYSLKDKERALHFYRIALDAFVSLHKELSIAMTNENIGMVYKDGMLLDSALYYFDKAEKIYQRIDNKKFLANLYQNKADLYLLWDQNPTAFRYASDALMINETIDATANMAESNYLMGKTLCAMGKSDQAKNYIEKATMLAVADNNTELLSKIHETAYTIFKTTHDYEQSLYHLERYYAYKDSVNNIETQHAITDVETKYQTAEKEQRILQLKVEKEHQRVLWLSIVVGLVIVILVSFILFSGYRNAQKIKNAELESQKVIVENQLLRSQMNPHFIFNSLSSIQSFILQNRSDEADLFLSKFARLMRLVLHHSSEMYVPFSDEMESVKLYLELEQKRFPGKFDFEITMDEQVEPESIKVPPMLMQPFVENALIHGIVPMQNHGLLQFNIDLKEKCLKVMITDNGVGREKSEQLKKENRINHKSVGLNITRQRLAMLNEQTTNFYHVQIIDNFASDGTASGTTVVLTMPWLMI